MDWVSSAATLIRLIYVSKAVDPQTPELSESVLHTAHAWNAQNGTTGVLCQGQGGFLQVRRYGDWSMAHVHLSSDVDPQAKLVWPDFDPYSPSGQLVMARIDELTARGKIIQAPPP